MFLLIQLAVSLLAQEKLTYQSVLMRAGSTIKDDYKRGASPPVKWKIKVHNVLGSLSSLLENE